MRLPRFRVYLGEGTEKFMRKEPPEKYHDTLLPAFEIGCLLTPYHGTAYVLDIGYPKMLHNENLLLRCEGLERSSMMGCGGARDSSLLIHALATERLSERKHSYVYLAVGVNPLLKTRINTTALKHTKHLQSMRFRNSSCFWGLMMQQDIHMP
ncbi:monooxygenase [Trichophyton rubrum MR1459]|nr:monooxygenase [Trichophyton rubrum MR1459]